MITIIHSFYQQEPYEYIVTLNMLYDHALGSVKHFEIISLLFYKCIIYFHLLGQNNTNWIELNKII